MLSQKQKEDLIQGAENWSLHLDPATVSRFDRFTEMLVEWNLRLNLTRIPQEEFVTLHFLDSLALFAAVLPAPASRLIDVGTGAGFPGIPIAFVRPDLDVTLLDSTRKRLMFLDVVLAEFPLPAVRTLHGRAEEIGCRKDHAETYDLVTARAVTRLSSLAGWMLPLVRPGGRAVAYKSRHIDDELAEIAPQMQSLGGEIERCVEIEVPGTEIVRKLVIFRKVRSVLAIRTHPKKLTR